MDRPSPKSPPLSPTIYRDATTLYLDFGTIVQPFPFTEGGLSKALRFIPNIAGPRGGNHPMRGNISPKLSTTGHIARITRPKQHREILDLPEGMRAKALEVVKRKGMAK
jgi:hypothetical protein